MSENKDTPVTYTKEEIVQLRDILTNAEGPPACPRCNEELSVSGPVSAGKKVGPVFHVVCNPCRRHAAIRGVPPSR